MRLSKIVTKTGDDGTTGLADGKRISKDQARITALGDIDELNCQLGVVLSQNIADDWRKLLLQQQHWLFDLGGELAMPATQIVQERPVQALENAIEQLNSQLPPLKEFILPGGGSAAAQLHLARAICRRAERSLVALSRQEAINPFSLQYLNRLSDLLFVIARLTARADQGEVLWQPKQF